MSRIAAPAAVNAHDLARNLVRGSLCVLCLAVAGLASCSSPSPVAPLASPPPAQAGDGLLTIQTEKTEYAWAELSLETGPGIRATVVNHTDRTFYAMLGDGFNASPEQEWLLIAEGSHAFVEQWDGASSWRNLQRAVAIEGVRVVVLQPHGTYTLSGPVAGPVATGHLRLRVEFFDQPDVQPSQGVHEDFSNNFAVR